MPSAQHVLLHPLQVNMVIHLVLVARQVQAYLRRIVEQVFFLQVLLVREEQFVHRPEFSLCASGFRGFGGQFGMRMHLAQREVAKNEAQLRAKVRNHDLQRVKGLQARWALKITVFDEGDRGGGRAVDMVNGPVRGKQGVQLGFGGHDDHLLTCLLRHVPQYAPVLRLDQYAMQK